MAMRGFLVTLEGQDGCGKSTLSRLVVERLVLKRIPVLFIPEFSSNVIGEFLKRLFERNKFLRFGNSGPSAFTETAYILSDLYSQDESEIVPALQKGLIVIKERHVDSILACQIPKVIDDYPSSDAKQLFQWIVSASSQITVPNLTFFLEVEKNILKQRIMKRGEQVSESDFMVFERRQAIYDSIASKNQNRCVALSNNGGPSEAVQTIINHIFSNL